MHILRRYAVVSSFSFVYNLYSYYRMVRVFGILQIPWFMTFFYLKGATTSDWCEMTACPQSIRLAQDIMMM